MVVPRLTIHEVTRYDLTLLDTLIQLFVQIFPEDQRYVASIRACAHLSPEGTNLELFHCWVIEYEGQYVGLRLFNYLRRRNFGFGRYIGLLPAYRNRGIGRLVWQRISDQLCRDASANHQGMPTGLCSELDKPAAAPTPEQVQVCKERVEIFKRMGAQILDVHYFEPPMIQDAPVDEPEELVGLGPQPMLLQFTPIQPGITMTPQQTSEIIKGILIDHYHLPEDSWYVRHALYSIGARMIQSGLIVGG